MTNTQFTHYIQDQGYPEPDATSYFWDTIKNEGYVVVQLGGLFNPKTWGHKYKDLYTFWRMLGAA